MPFIPHTKEDVAEMLASIGALISCSFHPARIFTVTGIRTAFAMALTIVDPDQESFAAALIPETLRRTNLGTARIGDGVNLEFDMIAKYVRSLVAPYLPQKQ